MLAPQIDKWDHLQNIFSESRSEVLRQEARAEAARLPCHKWSNRWHPQLYPFHSPHTQLGPAAENSNKFYHANFAHKFVDETFAKMQGIQPDQVILYYDEILYQHLSHHWKGEHRTI